MSKIIIINVDTKTSTPEEIRKTIQKLYNAEIDPGNPVMITQIPNWANTYPQHISCSS